MAGELKRTAAVAVLSVLCLLWLAAPAVAVPGVPAAPTTVYEEGFQNVPGAAGNASQAISNYVSTSGTRYTASPSWLDTANCNGIVANARTTSAQSCPSATYSGFGAGMMRAMGIENGSADPFANYGLLEITRLNNIGADTIQLQTVNGVATTRSLSNRFVSFGITLAATTCNLPAAPDITLALVNDGVELPTGAGIDPCTDPRGHISTVTTSSGGAIHVGSYSTPGSTLVGTSGQLGFIVRNLQTNGSNGNDVALDDVRILDATPQLDKSFAPTEVNAGDSSRLTFTVTNTSDLAAKNGWSFTDSLAAGLTVADPADASTTCSAGGVSAPPGASSIAATGNLAAGQAACTVSVNVTSASSGTFTNGPSNVTPVGLNPPGSASVRFVAADLSIVKRASPSPAVPGTNETYTLAVSNHGPDAAEGVVVSDPLPEGLSLVSASPGCHFAGGVVTCELSSLAAQAAHSFTVVAHIASSVTSGIVNAATVTSSTTDPNPGNNSSTASAAIGPQADLELTKAASLSTVGAGGQVSYTLVVTNHGPSDASHVTVSDPLAPALRLVSATASQGSCTTTAGVVCRLGGLESGGSAQILVTATVAAGAAGTITNQATVTGGNPDPNPANNHAASAITVIAPPAPPQPVSDLRIVKTVNPARAYPGQKLTYRLKVSNRGPDAATDVRVIDTASVRLRVLSAHPSRGRCRAGHPLDCRLGTLAAHASTTVTMVARIERAGRALNAAGVTSASADPHPADNLARARTRTLPTLRLAKTAAPRRVHAGQAIRYRLTVTNPGSVAIHHVKVCDRLPAQLRLLSASPGARLSGHQPCWTIATLRAHRAKRYTLLAVALPGPAGTLINRATASAPHATDATARTVVYLLAASPAVTG